MNYARMASRMHEHYRFGAEYGCSVTRYQTAKERNWQRAQKVIYAIGVVAVVCALAFNRLGAA